MRIKSSRYKRDTGWNLPWILGLAWLGIFALCALAWQVALQSTVFSVMGSSSRSQATTMLEVEPLVLLTTANRGTTASTDVRGNLGPAAVVLQNETENWLKDRWQAASDMHGTAIKGAHWVHVEAGRRVRVQNFLLDWETAYADDYRLEGWYHNQSVVVYFDSEQAEYQTLRSSHSFGQSPGVKQKLPLHIIHKIKCPEQATSVTVDALHLSIRKPFHAAWGVSLWRFQAFGYEQV